METNKLKSDTDKKKYCRNDIANYIQMEMNEQPDT